MYWLSSRTAVPKAKAEINQPRLNSLNPTDQSPKQSNKLQAEQSMIINSSDRSKATVKVATEEKILGTLRESRVIQLPSPGDMQRPSPRQQVTTKALLSDYLKKSAVRQKSKKMNKKAKDANDPSSNTEEETLVVNLGQEEPESEHSLQQGIPVDPVSDIEGTSNSTQVAEDEQRINLDNPLESQQVASALVKENPPDGIEQTISTSDIVDKKPEDVSVYIDKREDKEREADCGTLKPQVDTNPIADKKDPLVEDPIKMASRTKSSDSNLKGHSEAAVKKEETLVEYLARFVRLVMNEGDEEIKTRVMTVVFGTHLRTMNRRSDKTGKAVEAVINKTDSACLIASPAAKETPWKPSRIIVLWDYRV